MSYALPIAYAVFTWWFCTGIIFYLDGLPVRTFRWSMLAATAVLILSIWGLWNLSDNTASHAPFIAFTCGVLAWGWLEISLYMGYVTGPRTKRCMVGCSGWRHFIHAVEANLWHELAILAVAFTIVAVSWDGSNQIGMWTFLVLWWMHLSARLNVFLGVRNVSEEFVPAHMDVLKGFLTRKPMNLLFPVSVTVLTGVAVVVFMAATSADTAFETTSLALLGALLTLGLLEHWLLMLPLPAEKLWRWALSTGKETTETQADLAKKINQKKLEMVRAG